MASKSESPAPDPASAAPAAVVADKPVRLRHVTTGVEYPVDTAAAFHNVVYSGEYELVDPKTMDEAIARLSGKA